MDFWMAEIERMDQQNDDARAREGLAPRQNHQAKHMKMAELERADPNKLIYVPEDWMRNEEQSMDKAFESATNAEAEVFDFQQ